MKPNANAAGVKTAQIVPFTVQTPTTSTEETKTVKETKKEVTAIPPTVESVAQMKNRIGKLNALSHKHEDLTTKLTRLEMFAINKDGDTARIRLVDARGESFESSNPKCIREVIDIWMKDFTKAIDETEKEIRNLYAC
mgnify:CR=1 FL=1